LKTESAKASGRQPKTGLGLVEWNVIKMAVDLGLIIKKQSLGFSKLRL
jgi:hypothetical protein